CFILFCHCTLCLIILSSFSYCYADLRALHSFPTRRSSDLVQALVVVECVEEQALLEGCQGKDVLEGGCRGAGHVFQLLVRWGLRSEEHTSELQSRFDLVCRLLLEKKNVRSQSKI